MRDIGGNRFLVFSPLILSSLLFTSHFALLTFSYSWARTVILMGSKGLSRSSRGPATIWSTTSIPFTTFPNTEYLRSKLPWSSTQIKNCDPLSAISLVESSERGTFAIETEPRRWGRSLVSGGRLNPGPPVPCRLRSGFLLWGSPPWIKKPGMTRWNEVPSKNFNLVRFKKLSTWRGASSVKNRISMSPKGVEITALGFFFSNCKEGGVDTVRHFSKHP